ncbi:MAG: hypothetical protein KKD89_01690 [Candidatus Omnitrophica bacterium]|nr:hypothetical protein [Candidatus Omnitrophota bacterium]MBU1767262.1 hypothetical protein [Candidatus Omnitrophota bacterium]MBU1888772.1 hypothetical protein [Candidatus Omnitrophota bacterium]
MENFLIMSKKHIVCVIVFCLALIYIILLSPALIAEEIADIHADEKLVSQGTDITRDKVPFPPGTTLHQKAVFLARNGNLEEAITLINKALEETNNAPEVVSDYAVILAWAGRCQESINIYEGLPADYTPPNYILPEVAKCYRTAKEYNKSITLYKEYLKLEIKDKEQEITHKEATKGLIYTYLDNNQIDTARQYVEERITKEPKNENWLHRFLITDIAEKEEKLIHQQSVMYARNGDFEKAFTLINEALDKSNNAPEVVSDYIVILAWSGQCYESIMVYEKLPENYIPSNYILPEIAKCYRVINEYDKAATLYKQYLEFEIKDEEQEITHKEAIKGLIYNYLDNNQTNLARQYVEERIDREPENKDWLEPYLMEIALKEEKLLHKKAVIYAQNGDFKNAFALINEALQKSESSPDVISDHIIILAWSGRYNEAINAYEGLPAEYNLPAHVLPEVAKCYRVIGEYDKAIEIYKQYLALEIKDQDKEVTNKEATKGLIYTYLDSNQTDIARQYIEERIAKDTKNKDWLKLYLIDILLLQDEITVDEAEIVYMEMFEKDPLNIHAKLGISKMLLAKGAYEEAKNFVSDILNKEPDNIEALFLKAELLDSEREYIEAYEVYEKILGVYPNSQPARNLKYKALISLGAYSLVEQKLEESGDMVDPAIREALLGNEAMVRIWWGEPDIALEILDRNMDHSEEFLSEEFLSRTKNDRVLALQEKQNMQEIINEYENLKNMNEEIPPWTSNSTAGAYLYVRQPEQALTLYEETLREGWDPLYGETRRGIYASEVELGEYEKAGAVLEELDAEMPTEIIHRGILQDNWWKEEIGYNRAWWYLYQDRLAESQRYLENLLYIGPANLHTRTALAQAYLWRGWPRKALKEFEIIQTMNAPLIDAQTEYTPTEDITSKVGYCYALDENDEGIQARALAKELLRKYPTNTHIQRLNRYFEVQDMRTFTLDASVANEIPGAHETYWSVKLDQPLYPWRKIFAMYAWQQAFQGDSRDDVRRASIGMDWRLNRDWWFIAMLSQDEEDNKELGLSGEVTYNPSDYFSFNLMHDSKSLSVPLQAKALGVEAEEYRFVGIYRQSESFLTQVTSNLYQLSDGNEILSYGLRFDKALTTRAYWKTRVALEGYTSTNSETELAYYSPEEFYSIYLVPMVEHVWYRRYESAMVDRLYVGIGTQKEKDFSEKGIWYIQYEQDYRISDTLAFLIGVNFSKKNYSGEYTDITSFYLTLTKNF